MKKWLFLAALLCSQGAYAKWESYYPAKLSDGVTIASHAGHGGFVVFHEGYAFRAEVIYTGALRPTSVAGSQVLSRFFGLDRDFPLQSKKYGNELKVSEDGKDYWMPVPFDLVNAMRAKLRAGEKFTAYVRLLGASGGRWIFLLDGFDTGFRKP